MRTDLSAWGRSPTRAIFLLPARTHGASPVEVLNTAVVPGAETVEIRTGQASVESTNLPEAPMHTQKRAEALADRLEDVFRRLAYGNHALPGSCCACLQDMETRGLHRW